MGLFEKINASMWMQLPVPSLRIPVFDGSALLR